MSIIPKKFYNITTGVYCLIWVNGKVKNIFYKNSKEKEPRIGMELIQKSCYKNYFSIFKNDFTLFALETT